MILQRRLNMQLPVWARLGHPALHYTLGKGRISRRGWLIQLIVALVLIGLFYVGYRVLQPEIAQSFSAALMSVLWIPVFVGQIIMSILAMTYTAGIIGDEKRRQNWDNLRATRDGVMLTMRARWSAAVFYRLPGLLTAFYVARLMVVFALIYDLTAFQGEYLSYLTGTVSPEIPVALGVLLLALLMTASFVLPLTALGFDAAFGLLVATFVRSRVFVALVQIVLAVMRTIVPLGLLALIVGLTTVLTPSSTTLLPDELPNTAGSLAILLGFSTFGDWGFRFLHLQYIGDLWGLVNFSVFIGFGMLVVAFLQALLTDGMIALAVRRAQYVE